MNNRTKFIAGVILIVLVAGGLLLWHRPAEAPTGFEDPEHGVIVATGTDVWLKIGEAGQVGGLRITFRDLVQDVRCEADDDNCPEAGAVNVNVALVANGTSETRNIASDDVPYEFGAYRISILDVSPERLRGVDIDPRTYRVQFRAIEKP